MGPIVTISKTNLSPQREMESIVTNKQINITDSVMNDRKSA